MGMFKDFLFEPDDDEEKVVQEEDGEIEIFNTIANINVYAPTCLKDMIKPADSIKQNDTVVLNFTKLDKLIAQRCIDFIFGVVYALNGKMTKVEEDIFICTPKVIRVDDERND